MKKVAIILCTWQGERYLAEFLDSILAQTYQNWKIYAADDCSTDQTLEIIERYRQQYPDKFVNLGRNKDNKGACRNFLEALANPSGDSADYYMFADQDDVWYPEKISRSVEVMRRMEAEASAAMPLLAHCDSKVAGEDLQEIFPSYTAYLGMDQYNNKFPHLLLQNIVTGGGTIINHALRDKMLTLPEHVVMHDHWAALIASAFGRIEYIDEQLYAYRQHGDNEIGARKGGFLTEVMSRLGIGKGNDRKKADQESGSLYRNLFLQAASFRSIFGGELDERNKRALDAFIAIPNYGRVRKILTVLRYGIVYDRFYRTFGELLFI